MVRVAVCELFSLVKRLASPSAPQWGAAVGHQVTRVVVAGVLLAASLLKFWSIGEAGSWLAAGNALTATLATMELVAGVVLLVRRPGTVLWTMYTVGFVWFACISGYHAWNGAPTCGCFGNMSVPPAWTLVLDLAIVAALLAFPPAGFAIAASGPPVAWSRGLACVFALSSLALGGGAIAGLGFGPAEKELAPGVMEKGDQIVLMPAKWVGHPLPLLDLLGSAGEVLRTGEWEVWIIDSNCSHCKEVIRRRIEERTISKPISFLAVVLQDSLSSVDGWFAQSIPPDAIFAPLPEKRLISSVPACLWCEDSVVRRCSRP